MASMKKATAARDSVGEQLHALLRLALKAAEEAEVYYASGQETPVRFEANRLKMLESEESTGVALRLIKDGRIGFAAAFRADGFESLLDAALETVPFGAQAHFHLPAPAPSQAVEIYDPATERLQVEEMADLGQRAIDRVRREWPELLCEAGVSKGTSHVRLVNSAGLDVKYRKTYLDFGLEGTLVRGTDMLFVGDGASSCRADVDTGLVVERTLEQLELARQVVPAPSGELPVVFTPHGVAGVLLGPLLSAFSGKTVLQGADRKSTRLNSSHRLTSRMPSSA
jgi:PmbA protein